VLVVVLHRSRLASARVFEPLPDHARPQPGIAGDTVTHQHLGQLVLRKHDVGVGADEGGGIAHLVEDEQQGRSNVDRKAAAVRDGVARQSVQMIRLVVSQAQCARERTQHLRRRLCAPRLFQPDVVVHRHSRQLRNFFAA
jgi:hypothetical protein